MMKSGVASLSSRLSSKLGENTAPNICSENKSNSPGKRLRDSQNVLVSTKSSESVAHQFWYVQHRVSNLEVWDVVI
jgi:hypothetical protein